MATVRIENTEARLHHIGKDITLTPGDNDVSAPAWAEARKNRIVQLHIEARHFIEKDVKALEQVDTSAEPAKPAAKGK
jgi:hypothetical protein